VTFEKATLPDALYFPDIAFVRRFTCAKCSGRTAARRDTDLIHGVTRGNRLVNVSPASRVVDLLVTDVATRGLHPDRYPSLILPVPTASIPPIRRRQRAFSHVTCSKAHHQFRGRNYGSENPADPAQTTRVLTIMLAEEY